MTKDRDMQLKGNPAPGTARAPAKPSDKYKKSPQRRKQGAPIVYIQPTLAMSLPQKDQALPENDAENK
jgi:hypothetical protein